MLDLLRTKLKLQAKTSSSLATELENPGLLKELCLGLLGLCQTCSNGWHSETSFAPGECPKRCTSLFRWREQCSIRWFCAIQLLNPDSSTQALQDATHEECAKREGEHKSTANHHSAHSQIPVQLQGIPPVAFHWDHTIQWWRCPIFLVKLFHPQCVSTTQALSIEKVAEGQREEGARQWKQVGMDPLSSSHSLFSLHLS